MIGHHRVEGYAIISADGMIADAAGAMPEAIRNKADQKFLQAVLDQAGVIIQGRHSHEGGPRAERRKRLILTRTVAATAPGFRTPMRYCGIRPECRSSKRWRPSAPSTSRGDRGHRRVRPVSAALRRISPHPRGDAKIPGGRPVFPQVDAQTAPEQVLASAGLRPVPPCDIDVPAGITFTTWVRL